MVSKVEARGPIDPPIMPSCNFFYLMPSWFRSSVHHSRRLDQRLNVPVHRRCDERRSLQFQPSTRPGIEPGTFWLVVRDLTNCANLAHTVNCWQFIMCWRTCGFRKLAKLLFYLLSWEGSQSLQQGKEVYTFISKNTTYLVSKSCWSLYLNC